jgi:hypothetical protein
MSSRLLRRVRRKASRIISLAKPRLGSLARYHVEGEHKGDLWLFSGGRYRFVPTSGSEQLGYWHHIDGSLLVFDHYVMTGDTGRTFYSPWIKLTLVGDGTAVNWPNCNPFFFDPARSAYDVPKLADREHALLQTIPPDAVIAEIGVETGTYSRVIREHASPRLFHLIDVWETVPDPWPSYEAQAKNFRDVCEMFSSEISRSAVVVHKGDDLEILLSFPDEYFDWVYIDTTHQYEQTLRELRAVAPKMKPSGLICGHDYTDSTVSRRYGWGVIRAVNEFVRRGDWEYRFLTHSASASFALGRR